MFNYLNACLVHAHMDMYMQGMTISQAMNACWNLVLNHELSMESTNLHFFSYKLLG